MSDYDRIYSTSTWVVGRMLCILLYLSIMWWCVTSVIIVVATSAVFLAAAGIDAFTTAADSAASVPGTAAAVPVGSGGVCVIGCLATAARSDAPSATTTDMGCTTTPMCRTLVSLSKIIILVPAFTVVMRCHITHAAVFYFISEVVCFAIPIFLYESRLI